MRELNLQYRGKDKTTDVLSFPQIEQFKRFKQFERLTSLGDIVINLHQAKRQSKEHGFTFYAEIAWLLIHGLLHLLGYNHRNHDDGSDDSERDSRMRDRESEIMRVSGYSRPISRL